MATEVKNDFNGGLNLDDSLIRVGANQYIDALNITKNAIEGSNDKIVTNLVGNRVVNYTYQGGTVKTIGAKEHNIRNTVIELAWHSNGYHSIIEFDATTRVRTKIFENLTDSAGVDVLGFLENKKITSINIYPRDLEGDLLFFLDSLGRPTTLNIQKFKSGVYTPVTRDILDVAKNVPLSPVIDVVYNNDTARRSNNLRKQFRFRYRYVYRDFQKSTCSPVSETPIAVNILDDTFTGVITNNNVIEFKLTAGNKEVQKIEILMSYADKSNTWSDWYSVDIIDTLGIAEGTLIPYSFYNDSTYAEVDINEVLLLFDYVPDNANCQEILDGNILGYAGITEGFDKELVPNVVLAMSTAAVSGTGGSTGSLNGVFNIISDQPNYQIYSITFTGNPIAGTVVTIRQYRASNNDHYIASQITTVIGDTANSVVQKLKDNFNNSSGGLVGNNANILAVVTNASFAGSKLVFESLTIDAPATAVGSVSYPTFPFSTYGRIGMAYFNKKGKTNGILYNQQFITPAYNENGSQEVLLPVLNAKVYHIPPIWAHSFQWLMTKDATNYIYWNADGVDNSEQQFIYINISNFKVNQARFPTTSTVLNYSFKDGDRLRLIKNSLTNAIFPDTYDIKIEGVVTDPLINGANIPTRGDFIKIKKVTPISTVDFSGGRFLIQIYTPQQQLSSSKNQTFYEIAREYKVLDAGLTTRRHSGEITNQNGAIPAEFNFTKGEAYFRNRRIALSNSGVSNFNVIDRNIVDNYISAVNNVDGRPNIIDENARRAYFPATIRFGQAYQTNTNINGINRFYPNNFADYDLSFGDIMRMKVRGRLLKVFQKLNIGIVPLFNQINKSPDGNTVNVVTDKLLNPIQYRQTNVGIGENSESLSSNNFADYFTSNIKGVICRDSQSGLELISVLYKVNSLMSEILPLRNGNYKVYGGYNSVLNNYIISLEETESSPAYTLIFNEETNTFDSPASYHPEMMVTLGTLFISFKNGQLWTHDGSVYNNFYGVQYDSEIVPVFNKDNTITKSFMAMEENANSVWEVPEIETSLKSYGTVPQQSNLIADDFTPVEGRFVAPFLMDVNSIGGLNGGSQLKGNWIKLKLRNRNSNNLVSLNNVTLRVINSPLNNR